MTLAKPLYIAALLWGAGIVGGRAVLAQVQPPAVQLAMKAYWDNRMDSAVALFRDAVREAPNDASVHAWLAEAALRAGSSDEARRAADEALRLDSCNAQAHWVRASLFMPRFAPPGGADNDSTWTHLIRAVNCDSRDGNAWSDVWKYAVMRRDSAMEARALRALVATGFLTRPQLTYAEWVLRSLPPRAVLFITGDTDTYALLGVQIAGGVRPDVAVVNSVMLGATWYSNPVLARHQLRYDARPLADSAGGGPQNLVAWLRRGAVTGTLGRPLAFGVAAAIDTTSRDGALQLAGPYWLVVHAGAATSDSAKVAESLRDADAMDWRGPAVAASDRSPARRLHQHHPALVVARVAFLAKATAVQRDQRLTRTREQWIEQFLRRAGIDRSLIDRTLEAYRSARAH
jgi:hypothetical protein